MRCPTQEMLDKMDVDVGEVGYSIGSGQGCCEAGLAGWVVPARGSRSHCILRTIKTFEESLYPFIIALFDVARLRC